MEVALAVLSWAPLFTVRIQSSSRQSMQLENGGFRCQCSVEWLPVSLPDTRHPG